MRAAQALATGMKKRRRLLQMTQAVLAEAADLHVQYISQVERQERTPSLDAIDDIAVALGLSAAQLLAEGEAEDAGSEVDIAELLAAWPTQDRIKLVRLLIDLRGLAPGDG